MSKTIIIKNATIVDSNSIHHFQKRDILVENGIIQKIEPANSLEADNTEIIKTDNLYVSVAWLDMRCHLNDPGLEYKENLETLLNTAEIGGFSQICTLPNTKPVIQSKEAVSYLKNFCVGKNVEILPSVAITKNTEGKDFTEMLDLHTAGAVAFTDGTQAIWNADIFLKTLQYLRPIGGLLMNRPDEMNLSHFGQMHEGKTSTLLGLKGIPPQAETLMIVRDLALLEYALENQERPQKPILHFSCISTAESVRLIREAKAKGLPVSCDVAAHQLAFTDEDLQDFDTNLKVNPPFRSQQDVDALKAGLQDGTIDVIVSDHQPQDPESKQLEFDMAEFGVIGLETAFTVANTFSGLSLSDLVQKLGQKPRSLLNISQSKIEVGEKARLTLFDPTAVWQVSEQDLRSKSRNTPFLGKELKGRVLEVV